MALRLTNNNDDAADVVQDAYLRAYRSIGNFRGDAQFTTWLYRITANCASTNLSKRARHRYDELDEETPLPTDISMGPEAKTDAALDRRDVAEALAKLPADLRTVIVPARHLRPSTRSYCGGVGHFRSHSQSSSCTEPAKSCVTSFATPRRRGIQCRSGLKKFQRRPSRASVSVVGRSC